MSRVRGFGFLEHGGPDRLTYVDLAEPVPGPGEVRVRVRAAAFNRLDRFTLEGIPGLAIERPHALGSDGAGIVDRVGPDVVDLAPGASVLLNPALWDGTCEACRTGDTALCRNFRILGEHTQGACAELVVVPRRNVHPLPDGWSFAQGAAAPLVFQTAWRALSTVAAVRPGETVAIVGAGGAVATAAIQVAKLLGARVVVASRARTREDQVRALGADAYVVFDETTPLDKALWQWSEKRGIDVILDSVGTPTVPRSMKALARAGRVVVVGATAGPTVELDLRTIFWRQTSLRGSTMGSAAEFAEVLRHLTAGRLRPVIDSEFPFDRAADAFRRFDAPDHFGKIVVDGP